MKEKDLTKSLALSKVTRTSSVFNADQVNKMFAKTPKEYIKSRPAKGGGTWDYVDTTYMRRVLDSMFGFNWDFDVETSLKEAYEVAVTTKVCVVKATLTARTKLNDEWITIKKTQFGRKEVAFKKNSQDLLDFGNDMKAATSDALKKCASLLGVASDVYQQDDFVEYQVYDDNEVVTEEVKEQVAKLNDSKSIIEYMNSLPIEKKRVASPIVDQRIQELNDARS